MATIFINYRRADAEGDAGRLHEELRNRLPEVRLFMDVDSLAAGDDFVERLEAALAASDVMLVLIGRGWLTLLDANGIPRIDDPEDFVHREIAAALKRKIRLIPVLVQGALMPAAGNLPEPLKRLARHQAVELRHARYHADVAQLVEDLKAILRVAPRPSWRVPARQRAILIAGLVILLAFLSYGIRLWMIPKFTSVDISPYVNDAIDWLTSEPAGTVTFEGIPIVILEGNRAAVKTSTTGRANWPRVVQIEVRAPRGVKRVHAVVSASWAHLERPALGRMEIVYTSGSNTAVDLIDGVTVQEGWKYDRDVFSRPPPRTVSGVVWRTVYQEEQERGTEKAFAFLDLLSVDVSWWRSIDSIRFVDNSDAAGLVLVALTLER